MNVVRCPEGQRPKAKDVSPWYGVYFHWQEFSRYSWRVRNHLELRMELELN